MAEYSYNGWRASSNPAVFGGLAKLVVAGESFAPGVRAGDVHTVLGYVANQLHKRVEPVVKAGWHQADDWGYAYRKNRNANNLSCHASGTAIDYNATRHPNGRRGTFSAAQVATIRAILREVDNVVRWGGDFTGTPDEMHFEINANASRVAAAARKVRTGSRSVAKTVVQRGEGIDVYERYQRVTSWSAVRAAGKRFVYIKVSDGNSNRSDAGYARGAKAAGIYAGGYHYAQFGDPVAQANRLVDRCIATGATDLAPCLDLESPFGANAHAADFAVRFLRQIKRRGFRPCLYANNSMMKAVQPRVKREVPDTYFWVARYAGNTSTAKLRPAGVTWHLHQYSQYGLVNGIGGRVDLNDGIIPLNKTQTAPKPKTPEDEAHMKPLYKGGKLKPGGATKLAYTTVAFDPNYAHCLTIAPGVGGGVHIASINTWKWQPKKARQERHGKSVTQPGGVGALAKNEWIQEHSAGTYYVPKGVAKVDIAYATEVSGGTLGVFRR